MKINVTGQHLKLTKGMVGAVSKKCKKSAAHYATVTEIDVVLSQKGQEFLAEAKTVYLGHKVVTEAKGIDMYQCIYEMGNKLQVQLEKQKGLSLETRKQKPKATATASPSM